MKTFILCAVIGFFCLNHSAQAQCRIIPHDAEEWVEKNREKITKMTRAEWQELDEGYKWIVLGELSPKQILDFFREKIEQVMSDFEWNKEEKKHLVKLHQFFIDNPYLYDNEKNSGVAIAPSGKIEFMENWVDYAEKELQWTPKLIQGLYYTPADLLDKEGNFRVTTSARMNFEKLDLNE